MIMNYPLLNFNVVIDLGFGILNFGFVLDFVVFGFGISDVNSAKHQIITKNHKWCVFVL
jgi:hypothetical protein